MSEKGSIGDRPAFSRPASADKQAQQGMSLRQYYIGQAIVGLAGAEPAALVAEKAIYIADQTITMLNREKEEGA